MLTNNVCRESFVRERRARRVSEVIDMLSELTDIDELAQGEKRMKLQALLIYLQKSLDDEMKRWLLQDPDCESE